MAINKLVGEVDQASRCLESYPIIQVYNLCGLEPIWPHIKGR